MPAWITTTAATGNATPRSTDIAITKSRYYPGDGFALRQRRRACDDLELASVVTISISWPLVVVAR
jgi:hypothetical protein